MSDRKSRRARGTTPPTVVHELQLREVLSEVLLDAAQRGKLDACVLELLAPTDSDAWRRADVVLIQRAFDQLLDDPGLGMLILSRVDRVHLDTCACCRRRGQERTIAAHRAQAVTR